MRKSGLIIEMQYIVIGTLMLLSDFNGHINTFFKLIPVGKKGRTA